ncbi:MAG: hypothetical protein UR12_C0001G0007 [candidate division TM6 bacterium GW2011_GWF2_30_66]|jgi:outer membrane lipoprotein SlyB|nr:MAG: hypothetical protein UR12_C0001G0007 [candidate division TM6 bacterium GW2011_GWF2_30_66]
MNYKNICARLLVLSLCAIITSNSFAKKREKKEWSRGKKVAVGAIVGGALTCGVGAAIGAAAGSAGTGAAIGAGTGVVGGTVVGASVKCCKCKHCHHRRCKCSNQEAKEIETK